MPTCRECGAEWPYGTASCEDCGMVLEANADVTAISPNADFDREAERERFQAEYGIDLGDRTVDEYLDHLDQQDYSLTAWFWVVVGAESALLGLFTYVLFGPGGWELLSAVSTLSVLLSAAIYADTAVVGLFERWSRIRWLYIRFPLVPYYGQIATFIYLMLRRFERERTERERRRLSESGFDIELYPGGD